MFTSLTRERPTRPACTDSTTAQTRHIPFMWIITAGTTPGTIPGGVRPTATAGIPPGAIPMLGTTPGGMTLGTAGAGGIPSGTAAGPGTTPGITGTGAVLAHGALTTGLMFPDGAATGITDIMGTMASAVALPGTAAVTSMTAASAPAVVAVAPAVSRA